MSFDDRARLASFLGELLALTDAVAGDSGIFPDDEFRASLTSIRAGLSEEIGTIVSSLLSTDGESFDPALRSVGLSGSDLIFKHEGFRQAAERARAMLHGSKPRTRLWRRPRSGWLSLKRKAILSSLRWGNILLGSMMSVFPVPGLEAFKEYKDSLEAAIGDLELVDELSAF